MGLGLCSSSLNFGGNLQKSLGTTPGCIESAFRLGNAHPWQVFSSSYEGAQGAYYQKNKKIPAPELPRFADEICHHPACWLMLRRTRASFNFSFPGARLVTILGGICLTSLSLETA